jgi:hypothetical protein
MAALTPGRFHVKAQLCKFGSVLGARQGVRRRIRRKFLNVLNWRRLRRRQAASPPALASAFGADDTAVRPKRRRVLYRVRSPTRPYRLLQSGSQACFPAPWRPSRASRCRRRRSGLQLLAAAHAVTSRGRSNQPGAAGHQPFGTVRPASSSASGRWSASS